jgi:hypothetical protein
MDNCPFEYKLNCRNKDIKCNKCIAKDSSNKDLYYLPIGSHLKEHILSEQIKEKKKKDKAIGRNYYRKGRSNEIKIAKEMGEFNPTSKSNDGYIDSKKGKLYLEIKTRLNSKRVWPSKEEWDKFKTKGLDIFVVDTGKDIRVILSKELFLSLLDLDV